MPPPAYNDAAARAKKLAGRSLLAAASGLYSAGTVVVKGLQAGLQTLTADQSGRERVTFARLGQLEWREPGSVSERSLPVVLLGYEAGFQVWSLDEREAPLELVSLRRDGAVRWLEPVPQPRREDPPDGPLADARPLVAVVPAAAGGGGDAALQGGGSGGRQGEQHRVQLYSLRLQDWVRTLTFGSEVLAVQCSSRVIVVALRGQLQAFDAVTLEHTLSCLTYSPPPSWQPPPPPPQQQQQQQQQQRAGERRAAGEGQDGLATGVPCALGPRWLAYAADQAVQHNGSQAVAQRLPLQRRDSASSSGSLSSPLGLAGAGRATSLEHSSSGVLGSSGAGAPPAHLGAPGAPLTGAAVAEAAKEYARRGSQQLAGLAAAGMSSSYKYLSGQYRQWRSGAQQGAVAQQSDAGAAGTVMVRDVVTRQVVAHFRAHGSALAALRFTPDGTMLATASVAGHNINLFRIVPPTPAAAAAAGGAGSEREALGGLLGGCGGPGYALHLLRLHRGVTPGIIQGISFAPDASWAAVTSGRGTTHVFHLAAPGSPLAPGTAAGGGAGPLGPQPPAAGAAAALQEGVLGQPTKLVAVGRGGGKAGLTNMAGAATHAARSVSGHQTEVCPAAAAILPAKPGSPRALAGPHLLASERQPSPPCVLAVISSDGVLTRHMLRAPGRPAEALGLPPGASPATSGSLGYQQSVPRDAPGAQPAPVATLQEEARWDICRQQGWQEREELPPSLLPAPRAIPLELDLSSGTVLGGAASGTANGTAAGGEEGGAGAAAAAAAAAPDPAWLAQAEAGPGFEGGLRPPLWADPHFHFVPLPPHPPGAPAWPGDALSARPGRSRASSDGLLGRSPGEGGHASPLLTGALSAHQQEFGRPGSSLSCGSSGGGLSWPGR